MDTPVSKSGQPHVFVPANFYLRALDYKVFPEAGLSPTPKVQLTRATVARLRAEQLSELENITSRARRTPQSVRDADRNGVAEHPADLGVSIASDLLAAMQRLYRDIQEAKARYVALVSSEATADSSDDQPGPTPPTDAGAPSADAMANAVALPASMVITPKPSATNYPATMSQALGMRVAAGRSVL